MKKSERGGPVSGGRGRVRWADAATGQSFARYVLSHTHTYTALSSCADKTLCRKLFKSIGNVRQCVCVCVGGGEVVCLIPPGEKGVGGYKRQHRA